MYNVANIIFGLVGISVAHTVVTVTHNIFNMNYDLDHISGISPIEVAETDGMISIIFCA